VPTQRGRRRKIEAEDLSLFGEVLEASLLLVKPTETFTSSWLKSLALGAISSVPEITTIDNSDTLDIANKSFMLRVEGGATF